MTGWAWIRIGAILAFLAVAFGAFGAHAAKERLESLGTSAAYQTAAQYQMYHALALLAVGIVALRSPSSALSVAGWSFLIGVILFSGSLYALALTANKAFGPITPFGGLAMLLGWAAFAWAASTVAVPNSTPAAHSTSFLREAEKAEHRP